MKKEKKKEKNGVFSGHYVIASSLLPERGPLERRMLVPKSSITNLAPKSICFEFEIIIVFHTDIARLIMFDLNMTQQ